MFKRVNGRRVEMTDAEEAAVLQERADSAGRAQILHANAVKEECKRRIYEHADLVTQMNISAHDGAGKLSAGDAQTWSQCLDWVQAMRAACVPLITDPTADYMDDSAWPDVPAGAVDLAARF